MNSKILFAGIVFVLAIGFIFLLPYLNPTPNPYGGGLSCDVHYWSSYSNAFIDTTPGYLFECQENNANAKYYWKPDFLKVADVPSYFFDSNGKVIQECGRAEMLTEQDSRVISGEEFGTRNTSINQQYIAQAQMQAEACQKLHAIDCTRTALICPILQR